MVEENISQEKNIDKTRNYFLEEIQQNEMISKQHNKVSTTLKYIEHFLILVSTITGYISISAFAPFLGISIAFIGSARGLNICALGSGIKKSIVNKKKNTHDKTKYCQQNLVLTF